MTKVDLITGFLGSGKTTFLKKYAKKLMEKGEKICIIENDFGAINVDMVLLQELLGENCNIEMIVGGDGEVAHQRRLKTKLIAMGMLGYDRVIIEPSGVFDPDELFDILYESPIDMWYEMGSVICIYDAEHVADLSQESRYMLMSEESWGDYGPSGKNRFGFNALSEVFWSSTLSDYTPSYEFAYVFSLGTDEEYIGVDYQLGLKGYPNYVRCIKD